MDTTTFNIYSELDFIRITDDLENAGIPFAVRKMEDSVLPGITGPKAHAVISVDTVHAQRAAELIAGLGDGMKRAGGAPTAKGRRKRNFMLWFFIFYSFAASILLMKYWHQATWSDRQKHFEGSWNYNNTIYSVKSKTSGKPMSSFVDMNFDYNNEAVRNYERSGQLVWEALDDDEDGFFDRAFDFGLNGEVSSRYLDYDNNGLFDLQIIYLDNGDSLKLTDKDYNGFYELSR